MDRLREWGAYICWGLTLLVLGAGGALAVSAPIDENMGQIHRLLYLHLPVAANTLVFALIVFVASVGYLGGRRQVWDDLAQAAAAVTVLNGTVLLLTGMVWSKVAWGHWWVWSPRLCISLILWLLYAIYLAVRSRIDAPQRRAVVGAVYGVVAFLDVPLLYLSVKLLPDIHPTESALRAQMYPALWTWFIGITIFSFGTMIARFALARSELRRWDDTNNRVGKPPLSGVLR